MARPYEVYDKADYHLDSVLGFGLSEEQACVHIAFYLRWIIEHSLHSEEFAEDMEELLDAYLEGKISATELLMYACYGELKDAMLNDEGSAFTQSYYSSQYYGDFATLSDGILPSVYHTESNDANYQKLKLLIDKAWLEWRAEWKKDSLPESGVPAPDSAGADTSSGRWWKFW